MIRLRHAPLTLCALLTVAAFAGGMRSARAEEPAAAAPAHDACARTNFHVVVDVGHTVAVPGAMSARGVPEYTFNLALATKIKDALTAAGFTQTTLLITATAPWRGLFERA